MIFLDLDELLHVAERTLGAAPKNRDVGLLQSALARPQASVLGEDAYPSIHAKAAAMLPALARNRGLVDGNKRLALTAVLAFYGLNGLRLALTNDETYGLVMAVASGEIDDVPTITTVRPPVRRADLGDRRVQRGGQAPVPAAGRLPRAGGGRVDPTVVAGAGVRRRQRAQER